MDMLIGYSLYGISLLTVGGIFSGDMLAFLMLVLLVLPPLELTHLL